MMTWVVIVAVLAAILVWTIWSMKRHASRINDYFHNALTVYVFLGEEDAKIAALAAAKVAAGLQRQSMVTVLDHLARDLRDAPDTKFQAVSATLLELKTQIISKDWTLGDVMEEKRHLQALNPEYMIALEKADARVFSRRHPSLFPD